MSTLHQLALNPDDMRTLGYRVVDLLVDHFTELPNKRVTCNTAQGDVHELLNEPIPQEGRDPLEVLERLEQEVFSHMMHTTHPRFFAFVPGPGNFVSVMADALASGFNVFAGTWLESPAAAQIELTTVDWLRQAIGMPESAGGLFVSGGSMANITGLAVARHIKLDDQLDGAVIYCSEQTHSSVERGVRLLGFQAHQLRKVPSDHHFRLDLVALRQLVAQDRAAGRRPFCVVANAGTTNTGAIDPLPQFADYCEEEELWLHVDGAYGAAAILCEQGKQLLQGLERVDSLSLDPHKWLFQPYEIACVLVKERQWLKDTFHILPEYLKDMEGAANEINFCDYGIQLTRYFRALKLWMSLQTFGQTAFQAALHHTFGLAEIAEAAIRALADWEIVTPAQMAIVTFRYAPAGFSLEQLNTLNRNLVNAMSENGFAFATSTTLREQVVLRLCTINPRTTESDIKKTIELLDQLAIEEVAELDL